LLDKREVKQLIAHAKHHAHNHSIVIGERDLELLELPDLVFFIGILGCLWNLGRARDLRESALSPMTAFRLGHG